MDFNGAEKIPVHIMDFTKMQLLGAGKNLLRNSKTSTREVPLFLLLMTNRED